MQNFKGVWLPDGEKHLQVWMSQNGVPKRNGFPTYQYHKYEAAMKWVGKKRTAIDVGAFVGQWSRVMSMDFERVVAFEPVLDYRDCWNINMESVDNAEMIGIALGNMSGDVRLMNYTEGSYGDTRIMDADDNGDLVGTADMRPLDSFHIDRVDLIKIDCEGYEKQVIEGAMLTLERNKPVVIIEQKKNLDALEPLESLGAIQRDVIRGDYIYSWD